VPGVTAIDAASLVRSKAAPQPRNRLLSWISGEYQADLPSKAESHAIAPPDDEVRREILRLELEAQVAHLQAEADAIRAEAVAEGRTIDPPELGGVADETSEVAAGDQASTVAAPGAEEPNVRSDPAEEPPPA
jgi:hypothetical protein